MRKNWIFISIYIVLIASFTYFSTLYTEAQKSVTYLEDQKESIIENNLDLLSATVIANSGDGTIVKINETPLYQETFHSDLNHANVSIYSLYTETRVQETYTVAILIRDLKITDDNIFLDENNYDYSTIKANIKFNQDITVGTTTYQNFNETFVTMYDDTYKLILINMNRLSAKEEIEFKSISISYVLLGEFEQTLIHLEQNKETSSDLFDSSINRDITHIKESAIKFDLTSDNVYYNSELLDIFESYNKLYIKNISIIVVVIIIITYFIFFHSYVYQKIKHKLKIKNDIKRAKINEFKEKEK